MRLACAAALVLCAHAFAFDTARDERWQADLDALHNRIVTVHPNPYTRVPNAEFERTVRDIRERIPRLTDAQVAVEFARVIGMLNDGHSSFNVMQTGSGVRRYPLAFQWFSDGLFITTAPTAKSRLVGAKILTINGKSAESAFEAVRPWLSYDTESWARAESAVALSVHEVLVAARIVPLDGSLMLEVEGADGQRVSEEIALGAVATVSGPVAARPNLPLNRRITNQEYWFDWLENERTIYVQYLRCRENALLPISAFAEEIIAFAKDRPVERYVIDLRDNGGGASDIFQRLMLALGNAFDSGRLRPPAKGGYGLINKRTFSSGVLAAKDLKNGGAVLIGEPTGGRVSWFGSSPVWTLPNSRLTVAISIQIVGNPATGPAIEPDVPVVFNGADYFGYRDPYLEEALRREM